MLNRDSLASHNSQHVGKQSSSLCHHEGPCHRCFCRPDANGSAICALNSLAAQRCVLHRQGFSSSVCQAVAGMTSVCLNQKSTSNVRKNWQVSISFPKVADFFVNLLRVGLMWHTIGICYSAV